MMIFRLEPNKKIQTEINKGFTLEHATVFIKVLGANAFLKEKYKFTVRAKGKSSFIPSVDVLVDLPIYFAVEKIFPAWNESDKKDEIFNTIEVEADGENRSCTIQLGFINQKY